MGNKHQKRNILILAAFGALFFGQLVYLQSAPPTKPAFAQVNNPQSTCDPAACAALGGECAKNRADCDLHGMIPLSCNVQKDPTTGELTCTTLGGSNPNDSVCCIDVWGTRDQRDSCNSFKSQDECENLANIIHSCCWNGTKNLCVSKASDLCPTTQTIGIGRPQVPPVNKGIPQIQLKTPRQSGGGSQQ